MGIDHRKKTQPSGQRVKRIAAGMVLIFVGLYAAACGYLWAMQPRFIFKPRQEITEAPADYGLAYEDIFVTVDNGKSGGERMHAWWIPNDGGTGLTLLYLYGTDDRLVPATMSRELFERTLSLKALVLIDGGGHSDSARIGGKIYLDAVKEFIESSRS